MDQQGYIASLVDDADELAFLRRAVAGDPAAVRALVRRLMPVIQARVRRHAARRRLGPEEVSDLAQEVWLALIDREGRLLLGYDPARGASLEGYVGMIAEREAGNVLAKRDAQKRGGAHERVGGEALDARPSHEPSPEQTVATVQLAERLGQHLAEVLPPRGLLIFRLLFTDRQSPDAVARMIGVDTQVVYNWQHRIRAAAREFIQRQSTA